MKNKLVAGYLLGICSFFCGMMTTLLVLNSNHPAAPETQPVTVVKMVEVAPESEPLSCTPKDGYWEYKNSHQDADQVGMEFH